MRFVYYLKFRINKIFLSTLISLEANFADHNTQTEIYHFYLAWQNPDATGAVTYDGMEVKAYANVTPP